MENRSGNTIYIDSQSSHLFIGQQSEQDYDGRALSLARKGDIIITTSSIDPAYLAYWNNLGFDLPTLLVAGPFEESECLSTLILKKPEIRQHLGTLDKNGYDLHFFGTVLGKEDVVKNALGFPAYVNFDFAEKYRNKEKAKSLFKEAGIPTLPFISSTDPDFSFARIREALGEGPYLAKDHLGSGGKNLQTIFEFTNEAELDTIPCTNFIVEKKTALQGEIAFDWEITYQREPVLLRVREQLSVNDSFCGTRFPVSISAALSNKLNGEYERLVTAIIANNGLGPMSCDVLIDKEGNSWWSDLNPRKPASHYVCHPIEEMMKMRGVSTPYYFHHVHAHTTMRTKTSFSRIQSVVTELDPSKSRFILITNPNLFEHGTVDITAVSHVSSEDAHSLLQQAIRQIRTIGMINAEL